MGMAELPPGYLEECILVWGTMTSCETNTSQSSNDDKKSLSSRNSGKKSGTKVLDLVVLLLEEGVLGLAREIHDGYIEVEYYIEKIPFSGFFDPTDYEIVTRI
mgnify:FL=1